VGEPAPRVANAGIAAQVFLIEEAVLQPALRAGWPTAVAVIDDVHAAARRRVPSQRGSTNCAINEISAALTSHTGRNIVEPGRFESPRSCPLIGGTRHGMST